MSRTLLQTYGLKFHPFRPDVPIEALQVTPTLDAFLRRVELSIADGGYVMITGEPGTGKSVALRLLKKRLDDISDVVVGINGERATSLADFYRKLWAQGRAGAVIPLDLERGGSEKRIGVPSIDRLDHLKLKSTF